MSVVELRFYAWNDPNGTLLGTLTEDDLTDLIIRPEHRGAGAGGFSMSRSHAQATTSLLGFGLNSLAGPRLVKVHYPWMPAPYDTDPVWAFFLWEGDFKLLDQRGDDTLAFSGPGVRGIWSEYVLYHSSTVSDQPSRGSADRPGLWWWTDQAYGAIATRLFEEGRHAPYPGAAAANSTFQHVTIDFDRVTDSDGQTWSTIAEEYQFRIRTDAGTVLADLEEAGDFTLIGRPDLSFSAYESYGTDRTGTAYGAGVVRVQGDTGTSADNILTDLRRHAFLNRQRTHLLGEDKDGSYHTEIHPDYTSGPERWGSLESPETNDDTLLNKKAAQAFVDQDRDQNQIEVEIKPGDDEGAGRYLPFVHFVPGDTITVDTGSGSTDYNNVAALLTAFRVKLAEAADDSTADLAARSLHVTVELNTRRVNEGVPLASPNSGSSGTGHTHPPRPPAFCSPGTPGTPGTPATTVHSWPFEGSLDCVVSGHVHPAKNGGVGGGLGAGYLWNGNLATGPISNPVDYAVTAGTDYIVSSSVGNHGDGTGTINLRIIWYNSIGGTVSDSHIGSSTIVGRQPVSATVTAPGGAVSARWEVYRSSTGVHNKMQVGAVLITLDDASGGTPGDGGLHADLVGTEDAVARCDRKYHVDRTVAPTNDDDASEGFPAGTWWHDTVTGHLYFSRDSTDGAAIWVRVLTENDELGGEISLSELLDVAIETPEANQQLQYVGGTWVNNHRRWEPVVTDPGSGPELVWHDGDIVMTWADYS